MQHVGKGKVPKAYVLLVSEAGCIVIIGSGRIRFMRKPRLCPSGISDLYFDLTPSAVPSALALLGLHTSRLVTWHTFTHRRCELSTSKISI